MNLQALLGGNVETVGNNIKSADPALTLSQLIELNSLESAAGKRQGVLKAVSDAMQVIASQPEQEAATADIDNQPSRNAAPSAEWQQPEYTGMLSTEQAIWRRSNIKTK